MSIKETSNMSKKEVNEFKASYGVDASVAEPTGVRARKLPGSKEEGDKDDQLAQGSTKEATPGNSKVGEVASGKQENQTGAGKGERPEQDPGLEQGSSKVATPGQNRKVTREDIDVSDDVAAIFEGADLTEDFKDKAAIILETAVATHVNIIAEQIQEDLNAQFNEATEEIEAELTEKLDEYLDYVIESWMEDNALAVETGLRAEMTENFIQGLKNLFSENYVDIPEDKTDVVEELASRVEELEASLSEEMEKNIEYSSKVKNIEREVAFVEVTEGLTETQQAKLESLSEVVEFTNPEEYKDRLENLRESYFPSNDGKVTTETSLDDDPIEIDEETGNRILDPNIARYADYIAKSVGSKK
jgi:hypothetical protein